MLVIGLLLPDLCLGLIVFVVYLLFICGGILGFVGFGSFVFDLILLVCLLFVGLWFGKFNGDCLYAVWVP